MQPFPIKLIMQGDFPRISKAYTLLLNNHVPAFVSETRPVSRPPEFLLYTQPYTEMKALQILGLVRK
ncbi:MAG: hypothetical protein IJJ33_02750 [Victivallales bacterium]|nr:hypothetical protein [Victivallales bacterium]